MNGVINIEQGKKVESLKRRKDLQESVGKEKR